MARVTVEDCLKNVRNRFELVIVAAKRARQLMRGKEARVDWDNDKPTVVALREIAAGYTDVDHLDHRDQSHEETNVINLHVTTIEKEVTLELEPKETNEEIKTEASQELKTEEENSDEQEASSSDVHPSTTNPTED